MKKAAIYFKYDRKHILSNELTERSLKDYAKSLPDAKVVTVYTDISGNKFSEAKQNFFAWMIEDARARGIELLVVDDVSNLMSYENCWCPIENLRKSGIKVIEPKRKKMHKNISSLMNEWMYEGLPKHNRCAIEALKNKK